MSGKKHRNPESYDEQYRRMYRNVALAVRRIKMARPAIRLDDYPLSQAFRWKQ